MTDELILLQEFRIEKVVKSKKELDALYYNRNLLIIDYLYLFYVNFNVSYY